MPVTMARTSKERVARTRFSDFTPILQLQHAQHRKRIHSRDVVQRSITHESVWRLDVGGRHHLERGGPEPAVDPERLEAGLVAALHLLVAQPAGGVDVVEADLVHEALDELLLGRRLEADHVHAHPAAVVAAREPVPARVAQLLLVARPRDPVALAVVVEVAS